MSEITPRCHLLDVLRETVRVLSNRQTHLTCQATTSRILGMLLIWAITEIGLNFVLSGDKAPIRMGYPILEIMAIFLLLRAVADDEDKREALPETYLLVSTGFAVIWILASLLLIGLNGSDYPLLAGGIAFFIFIVMAYTLGAGIRRVMKNPPHQVFTSTTAFVMIYGIATVESWLTAVGSASVN